MRKHLLPCHWGFVVTADLLDSMYAQERRALRELIQAVNPRLEKQKTAGVALFISCSIEGMIMFTGAGKKPEGSLQSMKK